MKIFLENHCCDLSIRVHFDTDRTSFPVVHIENLFCFEGYVHVSNVATGCELPLSADEKFYLLPPRVKELDLQLEGSEAARSTAQISARQMEIMGYANKHKITIEILRHPEVPFCIDEREKPIVTLAMESAKKHIDIIRQATGTALTAPCVVNYQSTLKRAKSPPTVRPPGSLTSKG